MSFQGKTYWLIGASEGLGRALAHALSGAGARLVLSARNEAQLETLALELGDAQSLPLDVTDEVAVAKASKLLPAIDGVIYCAGAYTPMTAQEWQTDKALKMMDVNLLGAFRVIGVVLPEMIERDAGHIVLIGSLAGYQGLPGAIGYGASKAGIMHLGENLYCDLQSTKIKVQVINPGYIETQLTAKNDFRMPQIMPPEEAAARTLKLMKSRKFKAAYPTPFKWIFIMGRFLPYKLFAKFFG